MKELINEIRKIISLKLLMLSLRALPESDSKIHLSLLIQKYLNQEIYEGNIRNN